MNPSPRRARSPVRPCLHLRRSSRTLLPWLIGILLRTLPAAALPELRVTHDDTVIRESCLVVIEPGTVIADRNTNGVLHLAGERITVRFAPDSRLLGAAPGTPGNELRGIGIRIDGARHVRLENARVHGFFNGLVASRADHLVLEGGDFSDNYRQRLGSTPDAEDSADWLFPHHNDDRKWRDEYGGAICLEDSRRVSLSGLRVRRGQNGILLDRITDSRIFDNDCSFLSGWGLALWRSSRNLISRNAFDFCVRGHVEGAYNRGQDSAGILCFEQSNNNVFAENSATHGGDGFFGFAGREALGERWIEAERARLRAATGRDEVEDLLRIPPELALDLSSRGCNSNVLAGNDFSYASAHGIELTFSEGNVLARNRLVENAICGIWGGYSSDTLIAENELIGNGGMAYGLERGGINMEHASRNRILRNVFLNNKCAIHLWWDNDTSLLRAPGVAGNYRGVTGNVIAGNTFLLDGNHPFSRLRPDDRLPILHLRDDGRGNVRSNLYLANRTRLALPQAVELDIPPDIDLLTQGATPRYSLPPLRPVGKARPVGARPHLRGRHRILLDAWGPWDHASPWVRPTRLSAGDASYEIHGLPQPPSVTQLPPTLPGSLAPKLTRLTTNAWHLHLRAEAGVVPYHLRLSAPGLDHTLTGTLVATRWDVTFFPWTIDPRNDLAGWRQHAEGPDARRITTGALDFTYGWGGPRDLKVDDAPISSAPGPDHFGMIARTRLRLPAGTWRLRTLSDDGVRVRVEGRTLLENWTWHGPTRDEAILIQAADAEISLEVEHFEIDGYAVLRLVLEPVAPAP